MAASEGVRPPSEMAQLYKAMEQRDMAEASAAIADMTSVSLTEGQTWAIITIGLLYAIATLARRVQPIVQPMADAAGEHLRPKAKRTVGTDEE